MIDGFQTLITDAGKRTIAPIAHGWANCFAAPTADCCLVVIVFEGLDRLLSERHCAPRYFAVQFAGRTQLVG